MANGRVYTTSDKNDARGEFLAVIAWLAGIAILLAYLLLSFLQGDAVGGLDNFLSGALGTGEAVAISYLVGFYVFRKRGLAGNQTDTLAAAVVQRMREFAPAPAIIGLWDQPEHVDWDHELANAREVQFVGRYFLAWLDRSFSEWRQFFERQDTIVRGVLLDPDVKSLVRDAAFQYEGAAVKWLLANSQYDQGDPLAEYDVDPDTERELRDRIVKTVRRLHEAAAAADAPGSKLDVRYFGGPINHASICFLYENHCSLYMTFYDNFRIGEMLAPTIKFDLNLADGLRDHWNAQLELLLEASRPARFDFGAVRPVAVRPRAAAGQDAHPTSP